MNNEAIDGGRQIECNPSYGKYNTLVLSECTPVISALFGKYEQFITLGDGHRHNLRLSKMPTTWNDVRHRLRAFVRLLGLTDSASLLREHETDAIDSMESFQSRLIGIPFYISLLATHYGIEKDPKLNAILQAHPFPDAPYNQVADLSVLFDLALCMDDGHGLVSLQIEGHNKFVQNEICSNFCKEKYTHQSRWLSYAWSTADSRKTLDSLDEALFQNDLDTATTILADHFRETLDGIHNKEQRIALKEKLLARFNAEELS